MHTPEVSCTHFRHFKDNINMPETTSTHFSVTEEEHILDELA
jgi:hypothetical protein